MRVFFLYSKCCASYRASLGKQFFFSYFSSVFFFVIITNLDPSAARVGDSSSVFALHRPYVQRSRRMLGGWMDGCPSAAALARSFLSFPHAKQKKKIQMRL